MGICQTLGIETKTSSGAHYYRDINAAFASDVHPLYMVGNVFGFAGIHSPCFVYPITVGNSAYWFNSYIDTTTIKAVYPSAFGFDGVVEINQSYDVIEGKQPTRWFWAKNVGIVRKVWVDSARVESLIDYHVVQ